MKYKSMYKCELADAAGVSRQTFYNWTLTDQDITQVGDSTKTTTTITMKTVEEYQGVKK